MFQLKEKTINYPIDKKLNIIDTWDRSGSL